MYVSRNSDTWYLPNIVSIASGQMCCVMSYAPVSALIFISHLSSHLFVHLGQTQTSWPLILGQALVVFTGMLGVLGLWFQGMTCKCSAFQLWMTLWSCFAEHSCMYYCFQAWETSVLAKPANLHSFITISLFCRRERGLRVFTISWHMKYWN